MKHFFKLKTGVKWAGDGEMCASKCRDYYYKFIYINVIVTVTNVELTYRLSDY